MKTNQLRAMMLTVMLVITTLGGTVWAQPLIVKGTVTDGSDSSPLVGCAVTVKGTSRGTVTNLQGEYRIEANKGKLLSSAILVLRKWKSRILFNNKCKPYSFFAGAGRMCCRRIRQPAKGSCYRRHINRQSGKSQTPVRTYGCSKYGRI